MPVVTVAMVIVAVIVAGRWYKILGLNFGFGWF